MDEIERAETLAAKTDDYLDAETLATRTNDYLDSYDQSPTHEN